MTDKADNAPSQENLHTEDEFDAEMPQDDFAEDAGKDTTETIPAEELPRERIAKRIARSGVCSRRDAEQLIVDGKVKLNGKRLNTPAVTVTDNDIIIVNDAPLPEKQKPRLWRLFKKRGLVTSHRDEQGRETVFDNLPDHMPRVISVGRLDLNSEGLLLLTNDGELARYLELPSTGWARRYRVRVHGFIDDAKLKQLENGITIDGVNYGSIQAEVDVQKGTNAWMTITLREGKNREIRRVMEHLGWPVTRLMRLSYGPFHLGKMAPGEIDEITGKVMKEQLTSFFNGDSGKADPERDGNRAAKPRPKKAAPTRKPADRNKDRYDRPRNDGDDTGAGNYDRPRGGAPRPFDRNRQEQGTDGPRRGFAGRDDARSQDRNGDLRNDRNDRSDRRDKNIHPNRNFRNERKRDDRNAGDARPEGGYRGRNHQGSDAPRGQGRPDDRAEQRDNFRGRRDDRNSRDDRDTRNNRDNRDNRNDRNAGDARQESGYRGRNHQGSDAPRGQNRPDDRAEQRDNFRGRRDDRNSRDDRDTRNNRDNRDNRDSRDNRNAGDARQEGGYRGRNHQGSDAPRGQNRPDDRAEQRDNFRGRRDDRNSRDDRDTRNNRDNRDSRDNRDGRDTNRSFGAGNTRNRDDSRNDGFRNPEQPGGRGGRSGRRDQQNRNDDFADTKRGSGPEARSGRPAGRGKPDARRDRDAGDSQNRDTTNRPTNKGRGRYAGGNAQNNRQSDRQSDRPTGRSGPRPSGGGNGRRGGR